VLFNGLPFLYGFLPVTYFVFWRLKSKTQRYVWLTVTGYAFYANWNYNFCALMAFSILVAYTAGLGLLRWQDQ
jgi:D-alanyl-lipoteichoic acid acyltransferase DltB (MBOAT superfamily)